VSQAPEGTEALAPFSVPLLPAPVTTSRPGGVLVEVLEPAGAELVAEGVAAETRRAYAGDLGCR
jgi:hypothetical protein